MALNTLDILPRKGMYSKYERPADAQERRKRTERRRRQQQQQARAAPTQQRSKPPSASAALTGGMVLPSLGARRQGEGSMLHSVSLNALQPLGSALGSALGSSMGSVGFRPDDAADARVEATTAGSRVAAPIDIFGGQVETLGATDAADPNAAAAAADRVADQLLAQFSMERAGFVSAVASSSSGGGGGGGSTGGGAGVGQSGFSGASVLPPLSARSVADSVNSNAAEALADADRHIELLLQRQRLAAAGAGEGFASGGQASQPLQPLGITPRLLQQRGSLGGGLLSQRSERAVPKGTPDTVGRKLAAARVKQHMQRSVKQHRPAKNLPPASPWVTTCGGKGTRSAGEEAAEAAAAAAAEEAVVAEQLRRQGAQQPVANAAAVGDGDAAGAAPVLGSAAALEHFAASLSQQAAAQAATARKERRAAQAEAEKRKADKNQEQQAAEAEAEAAEAARVKAEASAQRRLLLRQEFEKAAERRRQQEAQTAAGGPPLSKAAKEVAKSVARRQALLNIEAAMDRPVAASAAETASESKQREERLQQKAAATAAATAEAHAAMAAKDREDKKISARQRRTKADATRRRKKREGEQSAQFLHQMEMEVRTLGDLHTTDDFDHPRQPPGAGVRSLKTVAGKPFALATNDEDARTLREIDAKLEELEEFAVSTLRIGSPVEKEQRALARQNAATVAADVNANEWEKRVLADLQALNNSHKLA